MPWNQHTEKTVPRRIQPNRGNDLVLLVALRRGGSLHQSGPGPAATRPPPFRGSAGGGGTRPSCPASRGIGGTFKVCGGDGNPPGPHRPAAGLAGDRPGGPAVEAFGDWEFAIVADQAFASDKLALSYLRPYGIQPKIRLVPSVEGAISLAHSGRCIALIDEWSREVDNNQFRVLPLDSCNHAVFAWDPVRRSPLVERFLTACWPDAHKPG